MSSNTTKDEELPPRRIVNEVFQEWRHMKATGAQFDPANITTKQYRTEKMLIGEGDNEEEIEVEVVTTEELRELLKDGEW